MARYQVWTGTPPVQHRRGQHHPLRWWRNRLLWSFAGIVLLPALGCLLLLPLRQAISPTDVAMLLLLWISAMALQFGKTPALLTTFCSVLLLNWCFVPPYYTLDVHDTSNFISFFVMAAFGVFISYLSDRLRRQLHKSRNLMSQMRGMYRLATGLNRRHNWEAQCAYASRLLSRRLGGVVQILPAPVATGQMISLALGKQGVAGAIVLTEQLYRPHQTLVDAAQSLLNQHWQLQQLQDQSAQQQLQVELEQQRAMLLRSLSHDLRTPLATIMGASSMLADSSLQLSAIQRQQQALNIYQQSRILNQHFEKVLELSKAQFMRASLHTSVFSAGDLIAGALARRSEDAALLVPICQQTQHESLQLLRGDLELMEMALANLLENALRHGAPPYQLRLSADNGGYQLRLHNAAGAKKNTQRDSGSGLGLRICQTVAALHQGRFSLEHQADGVTALLEWPQ